jgi:hypothetical protein
MIEESFEEESVDEASEDGLTVRGEGSVEHHDRLGVPK